MKNLITIMPSKIATPENHKACKSRFGVFTFSPFVTLLTFLTLLALHAWAAAVKEGYVTGRQTLATNTAEVFFPQAPTKTIRLVSYDVLPDLTNSLWLTFHGGTMPVTITGMINVTNLLCTSNTFVQTNAIAIIQRADDTIFSVSILGTNQTTNIIISATNAIPILTNDVLWVCTNISSTFINVTNGVRVSGESLFQVQRRAPLALRLTNGIDARLRINNVVVRYDDNP